MSTAKRPPEVRAQQRKRYAQELERLARSPGAKATYTAHSDVEFVRALRCFLDLPPLQRVDTSVDQERSRTPTYRISRAQWILITGGEMRNKEPK